MQRDEYNLIHAVMSAIIAAPLLQTVALNADLKFREKGTALCLKTGKDIATELLKDLEPKEQEDESTNNCGND